MIYRHPPSSRSAYPKARFVKGGATACSRSTRHVLLAEAGRLIRARGFSSFTLAGLATFASSTEAAVTECFGTEEALCVELIRTHAEYVDRELREISFEYRDAESCLIAYACLGSEGFEQGLPSLSSVLAAVRSHVSHRIGSEIEKLFRLKLNWIRQTLQAHHAAHESAALISTDHAAYLLFSALEGDAVIECALNACEPSATSFLQVLTLLGISRR
ncbi:TetR/AcrR family transcriptional regulator [Burkholderia sp. MR1-5-21]